MTDCSSLQSLLAYDQQTLQDMRDDPEAFCQNECANEGNENDRILCIRRCMRSLPQREQALEAEIPRLQGEVNVCSILLNVWQITANNLSGLLTFTSIGGIGGTISDTAFGLNGTIMFDQGSSDPDTIIGRWDELAHILVFQSGSVGNLQLYTGSLSTTPTPILQGTFTTSASTEVLAWSARRVKGA